MVGSYAEKVLAHANASSRLTAVPNGPRVGVTLAFAAVSQRWDGTRHNATARPVEAC